jgi:uncharacterized protein (TIGR02996 family)
MGGQAAFAGRRDRRAEPKERVSVEEAFLQALRTEPNDETTWLALADWLEENGQEQRAELVRLVRRLRTLPVMKRSRERARLEDRVAAMLAASVRQAVPEVVNSIDMRLALIPPGRFRMGSPLDEAERCKDEGPAARGGDQPAVLPGRVPGDAGAVTQGHGQ